MRVKLYAARNQDRLADTVADILGVDILTLDIMSFTDGEVHVDIHESVMGEDVYVLHTYQGDPNRWYVTSLLIADLLRRSGARTIRLIAPYLVYARQDVPDGSQHSAYASPLICQGLSVYDQVCVVDLHALQTQGFFQVPVVNLSSKESIVKHLNHQQLSDLVLVSPDFGGSKRVQAIHEQTGGEIAMIEKRHGPAGVESIQLLGDVAGKHCVLIDDLMVTGEGLKSASHLLRNHGAETVGAYVTHLLHDDWQQWQKDAQIDYVYVSDTVLHQMPDENVISIAPQIVAFIRQQQGGNNDS